MPVGTYAFSRESIQCHLNLRGSTVMAEDQHRYEREDMKEDSSLVDGLARGLADGTLTRERALKLMGAVFLGSLGAMAGLSAAADEAAARKKKRKRKKKPPLPPPFCGPATCPTGCCRNNVCQPGTS